MNRIRSVAKPVLAVYCLGLVMLLTGAAQAQSVRVEAQLIWATNDPISPNPKLRPVEPDLARRFVNGPFRWKYYFEVNRQLVQMVVGETKAKIVMSEHCVLDMKNVGAYRVEVKLFGDGKPVYQHSGSLANNHMFVLSGDAGNKTAWFVTVRQPAAPVAGK
jgi:hypothetical protein